MRPGLFVLLYALASPLAAAPQAETLGSPECREALAAVQAGEAEVLAVRQAPAPASGSQRGDGLKALEAARRHAARVCLGGRGESPSPSQHLEQPFVAVPPPATRPLPFPAAPALPAAPIMPSPTRVDPPVVTSCDIAGCWASDGTRLQRSGPLLTGPRGPCALQGLVVRCP